ncbi:MAG TPA: 16S rRNA (cytosine(967)-C(5))-methyltransferase RsmB [Firmicutes bacterium]|nr:16S rRNA (cytosine(967)-C(5))-methyltransferase RsmB [Bacillota bacterium]
MRQHQVTARQIAVEVLNRVEQDQAYANIELAKLLRRAQLDSRDRALATELTYGALRRRSLLDLAIGTACGRPLRQVAPTVLNTLRITAYQLFYLSHIPAHAAVNEAVNLVRRMGEGRAQGFVNAVARRMAREGKPDIPPDTFSDLSEQLATEWSHPAWLVKRWLSIYGETAVREFLPINQLPAPLVLRVNTMQIDRSQFLARLGRQGISAQLGPTPEAVIVDAGMKPADIPGYAAGWFVVQDVSSQLVAHALNPQPGETVADMCSAPGGKATHIAQLMGDCGRVIAMELHAHRCRLVKATAGRLRLKSIEVRQGDSQVVPPDWQHRFDRILLDAPCTGTGVLRRRVDLRWRLQPQDQKELVQVQKRLLAAAAQMLRPGGRLVYSTCSLEPEENQQQIAAFLIDQPEWRRGSLDHLQEVAASLTAAHPEVHKAELQLLPSHESDGFYLAVLERNS